MKHLLFGTEFYVILFCKLNGQRMKLDKNNNRNDVISISWNVSFLMEWSKKVTFIFNVTGVFFS